jgi:cyclomaltodextrinase / maltogenic alpha-amylase / neopullulanase
MKKLNLISLMLFSALTLIAQREESKVRINPPNWAKNATIYEVNVRQFTPEGTFKALEAHLPRLKKMGVDILWLMPINPIGKLNRKGSLGSYYAVQDYTELNPEFGTKDDFKSFVFNAHEQGLKVIVDWVANHTSPDSKWINEGHKDYYTLDSIGNVQPTLGTDWWDVADLNYDSDEMRFEMIEAMKYWVQVFNIDGYRCDVADWVPLDFWNKVRIELDAIKPVFMLAEAENPAHHYEAFDMSYGWTFHHLLNDIAKGKGNLDSLRAYITKENAKFPSAAFRMQFTSNHDENSWNGSEKERMGEARFALAVLAATFEGMPLVYNGQEAGLEKRLRFFDKDTINWSNLELSRFYEKLLKLHQSNEALWAGDFGAKVKILSPEKEKNVLVFTREKNGKKVLVVINMSRTKQKINATERGIYGNYTDLFSGKAIALTANLKLELAPWEYKVYYK